MPGTEKKNFRSASSFAHHTYAYAVTRRVGFNDGDILNINLITSYFNFVNRIALGLGVRFTPEEAKGSKA